MVLSLLLLLFCLFYCSCFLSNRSCFSLSLPLSSISFCLCLCLSLSLSHPAPLKEPMLAFYQPSVGPDKLKNIACVTCKDVKLEIMIFTAGCGIIHLPASITSGYTLVPTNLPSYICPLYVRYSSEHHYISCLEVHII
jgi:hypothetical protein